MNIKAYIKKAFIEESYSIAWRFIFPSTPLPKKGAKTSYKLIRSGQMRWWADPFPIEYDGNVYIFVELYKRFRALGSIGYFQLLPNGKVTRVREVLVEPFHLSFPNIFLLNGKFYMIPESEKSNQIRLYRAEKFPDEWVLDRVLATGRRFVDTSILFKDGKPDYLFSQDFATKELLTYKFDNRSLELIPCLPNNRLNSERCGGNCLEIGGQVIRVLQDCSRVYGEKLLFYRLKDKQLLDDGFASDEFIASLTSEDVKVSDYNHFERLHTLNRSANVEVIDLLEHRRIYLKPIRWLMGKTIYFYRKIKRSF